MLNQEKHEPMRILPFVPSRRLVIAALIVLAAFGPSCAQDGRFGPTSPEQAAEFVTKAEAELLESWIARERAGWVQSNFITEDTELMVAAASQATIELTVALAQQAAQFDGLELSDDLARKLKKLKLSLTLPAPADGELTAELAGIAASMESAYGRGEYCPESGECRDIGELSQLLSTSRDAEALLDAWRGWRTISPPIRADYQRFAELGNQGARELGFADLGAMWRSQYDMDPDAFAAELDRLWGPGEAPLRGAPLPRSRPPRRDLRRRRRPGGADPGTPAG